MSKKLIINADDFGMSEEINNGILECYAKRAITDMSILAVGSSFLHAVESARKNNIKKLGVHLALTGGFRAISVKETIPSLIGRRGHFSKGYGSFLSRYFTRLISIDQIRRELKNQIVKVKEKGFKITHLDSHHHIHTVPGIFRKVIEIAKDEGIQYIRYPLERVGILAKLVDPRKWARNLLLSSMCIASGRMLQRSGISHNDYFIGHADAFKLKKDSLISEVSRLNNGITELCCHPGADRGKREDELNALCGQEFVSVLNMNDIELVSY
ncbi:MAG: ChbG/HpnK family deacetylase [Candidatus Omnitrophota bacterium]